MTDELHTKVAIVTGGSSGIGRATVEALHGAAASVLIADIDTDRGQELADSLGTRAAFHATDVADRDQMADLITTAITRFGGLDIMVNNAAIASPLRRLLDDDFDDFHRVTSVNMLGVMTGTRYAAKYMAEQRSGCIINMASIGGMLAGTGVATYRATKAAVIHFTKCAAIELAQYDIRVNAISPGNIPTPLLASSASPDQRAEIDRYERKIRDRMRADRPLQRDGTSQDVAEAVLYFASERARYLTGVILPVDGGITAGKPAHRAATAPTP